MSILFTPYKIGELEIKNRFIQSATFESMAEPDGEVSQPLIERYRKLAGGDVGLVIPGLMFVHPLGRTAEKQVGIHQDDMIPGLKSLTEAVHSEGGKIAFQLVHAGRQTNKKLIGQNPLGVSAVGRDPAYFVKPTPMNDEQIHEAIESFATAAARAVEAGADAIQIHAAHGYLINQFLSPYFNRRDDDWGGTDENRFRLLKETISRTRDIIPDNFPLLVKLSTNDYVPGEGITPRLAVSYARWLTELGIDGLEISSGSVVYSFINMSRGSVPANEIASRFPWWQKPLVKSVLNKMAGKYDHMEGYNLEASDLIKPVLGKTALSVVGGFRNLATMEKLVQEDRTDFISMARPFIREPGIVKAFKEGRKEKVTCVSCNRCFAAVTIGLPVKCYKDHFPNVS